MAQSSYDLSVPEQVLLYLEGTPFASETAVPLSGGSGNYVYRIKLRKPYEGRRTLVLKHAKPYLPGATEFALDLARQVSNLSFYIYVY
jgi:5-methylthioribose kinase